MSLRGSVLRTPSHQSRPPRTQQIARLMAGAGTAFAGTSHLTSAREGVRAQVPSWVTIDADDVEPLTWATALHSGGLLGRRTSASSRTA